LTRSSIIQAGDGVVTRRFLQVAGLLVATVITVVIA